MRKGWQEKKLGDFMGFKNGLNFRAGSDGVSVPVLGVGDFQRLNKLKQFDHLVRINLPRHLTVEERLQDGDLVFVRSNGNKALVGRCLIVYPGKQEIGFSGFTIRGRITDKSITTAEYVCLLIEAGFLKGRLNREGAGTNISNLNQEILSTLQIPLPPLSEQKKIADILHTWDEAIEKTQNLIHGSERFLSWFRSNVCTAKVRIKGFSQPWKKVISKSVLVEHGNVSTGKEIVHSVSVHKGVIDQIEHLGRSFAAQDTRKYNRVHFGDLVYTKSPTGDFPWGIIKQSHQKKDVIVSPLYGVFRPATHELGLFLDFFFESDKYTRNYLRSLIQKGAKNTINITNTRFLDGTLFIPSDQKELQEIARVISGCRSEIQTLIQKRNLLIAQKRGLMQKLLTGEWPVRVKKEAA